MKKKKKRTHLFPSKVEEQVELAHHILTVTELQHLIKISSYCPESNHLVNCLSREVANTGGDGGDLQNLDDRHVRHRVDRVEQHQVECVDDRRAREGHLTKKG